jgi:hypothetical protein
MSSWWTVRKPLPNRDWRVVTGAESTLQDAQVTPWTGLIAWPQLIEQLGNHITVTQTREHQTPAGDAVFLGQGDQRLGNPAQFLSLRQGGANQLMREQGSRHVAEHGLTVAAGTIQLATGFAMAHNNGSLQKFRYSVHG